MVILIVALLAAPLTAAAQPAGRIHRIGFLGVTSAPEHARQIAALRQGFRDVGYDEGKTLVIEYRWAEGKYDRLPGLAAELVRLKVDLIVTHGTPGSRAAKQATTTIPIVMAVVGQPEKSGLVASLARPGGNVTGLSIQDFELSLKRLELLKQAVPNAVRVGVLGVPGTQSEPVAEANWKDMGAAGRALGMQLQRLGVRGPSDLAGAFSTMVKDGTQALLVANVAPLNARRTEIAALAARHRLPAIGAPREFAEAGGLLAYGVVLTDLYRRAAVYVDRILKGAKPADLPIEQATKFELVINLKTAKAFGLTIPPSVLARADQVIE
jgi:putative ABC transport system substrate-binding protein